MWHGVHVDVRRAEKEAACELGSRNNVDSAVWVKFQDMMENMRGGGGIHFAFANQQLLELEYVVVVEDERDEGDSDEKNEERCTRAVEKRMITLDHIKEYGGTSLTPYRAQRGCIKKKTITRTIKRRRNTHDHTIKPAWTTTSNIKFQVMGLLWLTPQAQQTHDGTEGSRRHTRWS